MAVKQLEVEGIGLVNFYKRRGTHSIRISLSKKNGVRVTLPFWVPYKSAIDFVKTKKDWIETHQPQITVIKSGYAVGKAHHIVFESKLSAPRISTRLRGNEIVISLPPGHVSITKEAQAAARRAGIRALKSEAEALLPQRLQSLARQHEADYSSVTIKQMSGRWGSCTTKKQITLNCFLMQLPWHLIDYVLIHELTHTKVMAHNQNFWTIMKATIPNLSVVRKEIRAKQPEL